MKRSFFRPNLFSLLTLLIVSFIVITVSCRKTDITNTATSPTDESSTQLMSSTNFAFQNESLDDQDFADASQNESPGEQNFAGASTDCKTVTFNTAKDVYPRTVTITYNNCINCDGESINGTKIAQVYMALNSAKPGDLIKEVTYSDFTIDSAKVSGDIKIYFVSSAPFTLHIVSTRTFVIPGRDGVTKIFNGDLYRTQIAGGSTQDKSDDVYSITGTASGHQNQHGGTIAKYTTVIDKNNPVIKAANCCWRSSGTETTTLMVKSKGTDTTLTEVLDYGNGTCDDQATLTINGGEPQSVTLPLTLWPVNQ